MICTNVTDAGHVFYYSLGFLVRKCWSYKLAAMWKKCNSKTYIAEAFVYWCDFYSFYFFKQEE